MLVPRQSMRSAIRARGGRTSRRRRRCRETPKLLPPVPALCALREARRNPTSLRPLCRLWFRCWLIPPRREIGVVCRTFVPEQIRADCIRFLLCWVVLLVCLWWWEDEAHPMAPTMRRWYPESSAIAVKDVLNVLDKAKV